MRKLNSRRRAAVLAAATAAMVPSIFLSAQGGHIERAYTVAGIVAGILAGGALVMWRSRDHDCA